MGAEDGFDESLGIYFVYWTKIKNDVSTDLPFCVPQFAGVSGEMCNQHNLYRRVHIQICKQDIAGWQGVASFGWQTLETRSCEFCDSNPEVDFEQNVSWGLVLK